MWHHPIVEEIHKTREEYARQFDYDVDAICRDIQIKQANSERKLVSFPARRMPGGGRGELLADERGEPSACKVG
uniref:Uncharacterized protein n=1 Tax=Candidatus Kentrum sp. LPFa TaxID=2126335 RepID=A0A450WXJ7_9GAMM|nr:MAG: hypothetical protein BECKLPF1236A_GA0070988_103166 [Candidatus Kentron sp. LPFa]VFK35018.1 MAG: hypothetical protein BECKLPF1236C_GA0070990_103226 [Candidatus Kentron sp. LPFa]